MKRTSSTDTLSPTLSTGTAMSSSSESSSALSAVDRLDLSSRAAPPLGGLSLTLLSLEAVFAAVTGWIVLGETMTAVQILGCALLLGGALMTQIPKRTGKRRKN